MDDPLPRTGFVCPACRRRTGIIEHELPRVLTFYCTACGHRWIADGRGTRKPQS